MGKTWKRVGLIINPLAGKPTSESLVVARTAVEKLQADEVFTGEGELGTVAFSGWPGKLHVYTALRERGREQTRAIAEWIAGQNADVVVVIGGDGTLSDVAQVCIERASRLPILGIGAGSTNVGTLITCRATRVQELQAGELETWNANCLIASVNDKVLGLGFNDVVIGYTIVGMMDGQRKDLDAAEHTRGRITEAKPRTIGNRRTRVITASAGLEKLVAEGDQIYTVVAGLAEPVFFGKAVTGGVCLTALAGLPAGCLVCNTPLARIRATSQELLDVSPVVSRYVSLSDETAIMVENVNEGAALCADGNPLCVLTESDRIRIGVRSGAVVGIRAHKDLRSA